MATRTSSYATISVFSATANSLMSGSDASRLCSQWRRLWNAWKSLQVGRQGSYSIERLESLDQYIKSTSRTRVLLVCSLTPLPSLLLIVLLECLPLRPPAEGWAANWMFWIRQFVTVFTMTFAGITKLVIFVPTFDSSLLKRLVVSMGASAAYVATALVAASLVVFPIPMMWILGGSFMSIYVPVMTLLVFGCAPFAKTSPHRQNLLRLSRYFFAYMTLSGIFPLYKVLYEFIPKKYRGVVIVVLPLWRLSAKQFMVKATREMEDFMPEIVAFTVDYFSALFVSVCISTSGSLDLAVAFIAADVGHSLLELHGVREVSKRIGRFVRLEINDNIQLSKSSGEGLVTTILELARDPNNFKLKSTDTTRFLPHSNSTDQTQHLVPPRTSASSRLKVPPKSIVRVQKNASHRLFPFQKSSVVPAPGYCANLAGPTSAEILDARDKPPTAGQGQSTRNTSAARSMKVVEQGLQVLFHWKYVALVEYVECVVPLVFVAYKATLQQLPNVAYYPGGASTFKTDVVVNILLFGALEIASFLLLSRFLLQKFAFSPLHQLAFVLETQMSSV